jgi:hypothetical protein
VNQAIDIQTAYVNSEHPAFKERTTAKLKSGSVTTNVDLLLELVDRYFTVCKRQIQDIVPKIVHRILIKKSTEKLRLELFKRVVVKPNLAEDPRCCREKEEMCRTHQSTQECIKRPQRSEDGSRHLNSSFKLPNPSKTLSHQTVSATMVVYFILFFFFLPMDSSVITRS